MPYDDKTKAPTKTPVTTSQKSPPTKGPGIDPRHQAVAGLPYYLAELLLAVNAAQKNPTLRDLMQGAIAQRHDDLLSIFDAMKPGEVSQVRTQMLIQGAVDETVGKGLTTADVGVCPRGVLNLLACRSFTSVHAASLEKAAEQALELKGVDPDEVSGKYLKTTDVEKTKYTETLVKRAAEPDKDGVYGYEKNDDGSLKTADYQGEKAYRLGLTASKLVVSVVIKLKPKAGVKDDKIEELKKRWLTGIQGVWNDQMMADNGKGKSYDIAFRPLFVDKDSKQTVHFVVDVHNKDQRSDVGNWDTYDKGSETAAHEFGHMLGNKDEYDVPVYKDGKVIGGETNPDSIMAAFGAVGNRHVQDVINDFNKMMGNPTPPYVAKAK